jgi:hypothetical protein
MRHMKIKATFEHLVYSILCILDIYIKPEISAFCGKSRKKKKKIGRHSTRGEWLLFLVPKTNLKMWIKYLVKVKNKSFKSP